MRGLERPGRIRDPITEMYVPSREVLEAGRAKRAFLVARLFKTGIRLSRVLNVTELQEVLGANDHRVLQIQLRDANYALTCRVTEAGRLQLLGGYSVRWHIDLAGQIATDDGRLVPDIAAITDTPTILRITSGERTVMDEWSFGHLALYGDRALGGMFQLEGLWKAIGHVVQRELRR